MLLLLVSLALLASREPSPPVTSFTNDDLERIAPYSAETGGRSQPAALPAPAPAPRERSPEKAGREAYWRAEARRVRDKVRDFDDRAVALRQKIEERRRKKDVLPYSDPQVRRWEQQAQEWISRGRELENDLLDRARREGALPGWLR